MAGTFKVAIAATALLLVASCGGGSGGDSAAPPVDAPPAAAGGTRTDPDAQPYWVRGSGVRPNLAHLLTSAAQGGVVALDADGHAWVRARAAAASKTPAATNAAGGPRANAVATQRRTVTGLQTFIFHQATGSKVAPSNLTARLIEAYAPDGTGGFEKIPATARRADGTYAIENVPEGAHWVRLGTRWVWTSAGFVDWSFDLFGRDDVVFPANPTRMDITAGNLAPWSADDSLAWVVPQHGYSQAVPLTDPTIVNAPRPGESALGNFGFELSPNGLFAGLLDAGKGDIAYLNQLATQSGTDVRVLARSVVFPQLTTADGSTTSVTSGFLDVAPTARLKLRFNRGAFAAQAGAVSPGASLSSTALGVSAFAMSPQFGTPSDAYTLLEFNTLGAGDIDFGTLRYGNPFPADWNRVIDGFATFTRNYLAPGATVSEPLQRGVFTSLLMDAATLDNATVTIDPAVTPPRAPLINGKSLFVNQLAVGEIPTLSWTAPALGVADYYLLRVLELTAAATRSTLRTVASLHTAGTTMTMPPGILVPGHTYVITIAAVRGGSPVTRPNRNGLPFSFATSMSAIVAP